MDILAFSIAFLLVAVTVPIAVHTIYFLLSKFGVSVRRKNRKKEIKCYATPKRGEK